MFFKKNTQEHDRTDGLDAPRHGGRMPQRSRRRSRRLVPLVLLSLGLLLFTTGHGASRSQSQAASPTHAGQTTVHASLSAGSEITPAAGLGAGASAGEKTGTAIPALCLNLLDVTCWLQSASEWLAQQVVNTLQPVVAAILSSPLNILTQTPPADSYQNPILLRWFAVFLEVVDLALAETVQ